MLKGHTITEKINIGLDAATKSELQNLKSEHNVDVPEWIRGLIREHLPELKKRLRIP